MVDPKRHINVLSPEEQAFLEECENEFAHRFTELDEEFMAHCQREQKPPPVVHPWNGRRNGGGGEGRGGRGEPLQSALSRALRAVFLLAVNDQRGESACVQEPTARITQ
uniref:Uncharacterized protein n=1 Tax=Anopheles minimus TaxID=112268 RepID=A0A182W179_9DIPT